MKLLLSAGIFILFASACVTEPKSTKDQVQHLKESIEEIESECTPQKGTSREEVETTFGEGKPLHMKISKLPIETPIPIDSLRRGYLLCTDGYLVVWYDSEWNVRYAYYSNPYRVNGRPPYPPPDHELLRELEPRLRQMKIILEEYRIKKVSQYDVSQQ